MYGWAGKILRVNLSEEKVEKQHLPEELKTKFIGGRGINVKILYNENKPKIDPFDPENRLIFGAGPLVGTLVPGSGRFNVTTKSPLGFLGDSSCGGHWAAELKYAGYDHIIIWGRAKHPVYLCIQDGSAELRDAKHLWGMDTWETQAAIREELGDEETQIACIGQAGENLVRIANVRTGLKHAAGRTGTGAVMGSKNLKAIAVRGTGSIKIADPEGFMNCVKKAHQRVEDLKYILGAKSPRGGTYGALWFTHNEASMLAHKHQQSGYWEEADKLDPKIFHEKYKVKMRGCFACPVACTPFYVVKDDPHGGLSGEGPEFEHFASFASSPANADLLKVLKACNLSDRFGIDCDSCGRIISFAMELYQRGIISEKDVGFPLEWGDGDAVIKLVEIISKRQGFGDILAEGEVRAAKRIGRGAEKYVLAVKNLEQHEPLRSITGHALAQSTSTRGSDHLRSSYHAERDMDPEEARKFGFNPDPLSYESKASGVIFYEHNAALADMLGFCKFFSPWLSIHYIDADLMAELFSTATGVKMDSATLLKAAERVYNVERAFIVREGAKREDDYPPWREFEEPYPNGPFKGRVLDRKRYDAMLDEYYMLHGWSATGVPTKKKLEELGLKDVACDLEAQGLI
ncbi:MAG: aldehyde ferredoxin oxidoreductase family protein [Candidatus Bathyarchaeia archaeon]